MAEKKKEKKERKKKTLGCLQQQPAAGGESNSGAAERGTRRREEEEEVVEEDWKRGPRDVRRGKREGGDKFGRQRERGKADKERWRTARAVAHCAADRQRDRPDRGNECSY